MLATNFGVPRRKKITSTMNWLKTKQVCGSGQQKLRKSFPNENPFQAPVFRCKIFQSLGNFHHCFPL